MFETNGTIYKIDTKNSFVDIRGAFTLGDDGKVVFQFRTYDKTKAKGNRILAGTDFYMNVDEFAYFCEFLRTGKFQKALKMQKEIADENGTYPKPGYHQLGGSLKNGKWVSRQLKLEGGAGGTYFLKALEGPGERTQTGLIAPKYTDKTATVNITIAIKESKELIKIGVQGQRAIAQFDTYNVIKCFMDAVNNDSHNFKQYDSQGKVSTFPNNTVQHNSYSSPRNASKEPQTIDYANIY